MRRPLILRLVLGAVVGTFAWVLLTPISALAAMDATLSSTHARPGDSVLLLTDDHKGAGNYGSLASENHQSIYLAATTTAGNWSADGCRGGGGGGYQMVGQLQWRGNTGGLAFVVPSLPPGDYWLFMQTSGQCWRVGGVTQQEHGPLVLSIGSTPADNQAVAASWTVDSLPLATQTPPKTLIIHSSVDSATAWVVWIGGSALLLLALYLTRRRATKPPDKS